MEHGHEHGHEQAHSSNVALASRVSKTENQLREVASNLNKQGENIASITTAIETQTKQIGTLLHRSDRPFPVSQLIAGIGLIVMLAGLALAPLYRSQDRNEQFDNYILHHLESDAREMGIYSNDLEWIKKLEDRLNRRIHSKINE